jgi:hypothetical protein
LTLADARAENSPDHEHPADCKRARKRRKGRAVEASYRIISQADGTFAVERTEPSKEPVVTGHFKTEEEARRHVAELKRLGPLHSE